MMTPQITMEMAAGCIQSILAQTGGGGSGPNVSLNIQSVWDFVVKGGLTMIPIGLVSLVAMTVVVERLFLLRRRNVVPPDLLARVSELLDGPRADRRKAIDYCKGGGSPMGNVLAVAIKHLDEPLDKIEKHVEEAGQREVIRLRRRMRLLSALPQVSTMLGLVGTIFGMIKTFQAVAASSEALGKTELLAKGIYEAWTTTASGLLVAIPVLVAYHIVQGKIDSTIVDIDAAAIEWMERFGSGSAPQSARVVERSTEIEPPPLPIPALAAVPAT